MKGAFFSAALLAALVFPACQGYDYTMDTEETAKPCPSYPETDVDSFRELPLPFARDLAFDFPPGTHVYEIVACLSTPLPQYAEDEGIHYYGTKLPLDGSTEFVIDECMSVAEWDEFVDKCVAEGKSGEFYVMSVYSQFSAFRYSRTGDKSTRIEETLTFTEMETGKEISYTFIFDSQEGILRDDTLEEGFSTIFDACLGGGPPECEVNMNFLQFFPFDANKVKLSFWE